MRKTVFGFTVIPLRFALSSLGALLFALSSPAEAQQAKKIPRIGYLAPGSRSSESIRIEAFRQALHDLGYVERKNIIIEYRFAEGSSSASRSCR